MTQCVVYWLHLNHHTDINKEGYVGITINFKRRMAAHHRESKVKYMGYTIQNAILKYGWRNIVREIVFSGTQEECQEKEYSLRALPNTGWNMAVGGNEVSVCSGYWQGKNLSDAHKQKMRDAIREPRSIKSRETRIKEVQTQFDTTLEEALTKNFSRLFIVILPNNTVEYCENLSEYCRDKEIRQNCMSQCASGKRQQHKGYYCIRVTT